MSVVRPLAARLVRQGYAADNVSRMLETLPAAERPGPTEARAVRADRDRRRLRPDRDRLLRLPATARRGRSTSAWWARSGHEAFLDGRVRGHEAMQPRRVEGLVEHFSSAAVRSELVALLHRPGAERR